MIPERYEDKTYYNFRPAAIEIITSNARQNSM